MPPLAGAEGVTCLVSPPSSEMSTTLDSLPAPASPAHSRKSRDVLAGATPTNARSAPADGQGSGNRCQLWPSALVSKVPVVPPLSTTQIDWPCSAIEPAPSGSACMEIAVQASWATGVVSRRSPWTQGFVPQLATSAYATPADASTSLTGPASVIWFQDAPPSWVAQSWGPKTQPSRRFANRTSVIGCAFGAPGRSATNVKLCPASVVFANP